MNEYFYYKKYSLSHLKEREEKVCLNCGADLIGFYCHKCGQQNTEPKESAWHLIMHFFSDLFHFDGKFFITMKYLAIKPGYLTEEYVIGRRARYVNPIRMYLFVSAVFFIIFTNYLGSKIVDDSVRESTPINGHAPSPNTTPAQKILYKDSATGISVTKTGGSGFTIQKSGTDSVTDDLTDIKTVREYDSIQKSLPKAKRDGIIERYFSRNSIAANQYRKAHPGQLKGKLINGFLHSLPYMLFVSLPLLALILQLLYVRRKQFFYVGHAIFTVHYFIFYFISFLLIVAFNNMGFIGSVLSGLMQIGLFIYLYLAMRRFYKQGWLKTFIKFLLFNTIGFVLVLLVFAAFGINLFLNVANTH